MRKIQLMMNQLAAQDERLRKEILAYREKGFDIRVQVIWEFETVTDMTIKAIEDGFDTIVAAGGDGTLNLVVNSVLQSQKTNTGIGVMPYGTANDFARTCEILNDDPVSTLRIILENEPTPIDVVKVNDRHFINVASGGLVAEITTSTPAPIKKIFGGAAYSITGALKMFQGEKCKATVQAQDVEWEGILSVILVCNGRHAGGGIQITEDAFINDGMLEVVIIPDVPWDKFETVIRQFFDRDKIEQEYVKTFITPWLEVNLDHEIQMNLDGEPIHSTHFQFENKKQIINFYLPKHSSVVKNP